MTEIRKAGERAAELTQKLLAFSRKQVMQPSVLSLNQLVREMEGVLQRIIGANIELATVLDPAVGNIKADGGQIEQAILNMSINARDAMPQGGHLLIETKRLEMDEACASLHAIPPGAYAVLTVTDTGCGMDEQTKARIFEPFFTTKEPGAGTGLGLSTVLGIVKQSGGAISVSSEVDAGTSFKIYLPLIDAPALCVEPRRPSAAPPAPSGQTILVVEDNSVIRMLAVEVLREHGYRVLEAASGGEALTACELNSSVDLLLTDVIMPGMNGAELSDLVARSRPGLKVLYMSGYAENGMIQQGILDPGRSFLAKPFSPQELLWKVGDVLAKNRAAGKVLIADDDVQVRSLLTTLLETEGYRVVQAANGKEAEEHCRQALPDLVITDLVMPEQEGLQTIHEIRRKWPQLPIVAISGAFGGTYLEIASRLGANAVLHKPFERDSILSEVRRLVTQ